jgi:hypothetical protein
LSDSGWLQPDWPVDARVGALMATRAAGGSEALSAAVLGARPVWLKQVHGAVVVDAARCDPAAPRPDADASFTTAPGIACLVQVADCLPVLFAAEGARGVAAAHAGWRGLAGGVLENTIKALCVAAACEPTQLQCWLGPCIGPEAFEVGADVLEAFGADPRQPDPQRFRPHTASDGSMRWLANLPLLARDRLQAAGVLGVTGGSWCTVGDPSRFFSFRRERASGRMAAAVWLRR